MAESYAQVADSKGPRRLDIGELADGEHAAADDALSPWITGGYIVTDRGLRIVGHEGRTRLELVPDVDIPWKELAPWLLASAQCGAADQAQQPSKP